jgi:hypothetical protein
MPGPAADDATGPATPAAVQWTVYEKHDRVHAVADVPASVPREEVGYGAVPTAASVFLGTPAAGEWPVALPTTVEPVPVSVSYNNGVVELVFERDGDRSTSA